MASRTDQAWWRHAVVYQIYPRSFADGNNDGTGDIAGMIEKIDWLAGLGVDAVWVSPWYPSPLHDGGYDVADYTDIHPDFGTLAQAEQFIQAAHQVGIRVIIDLVPNHCSDQHELFQRALAAAPGSDERAMFMFADGRGEHGELPPNNWGSHFGGPAWTRITEADGRPGQWYLHMFAPEQPDWNWRNPEVVELFDDILRFWFDRGVDGFRIDVADAMFKAPDTPDVPVDPITGLGSYDKLPGSPMWNQPELEQIQTRWRRITREYTDSDRGERALISEAYLHHDQRSAFVDVDRLHSSFNFEFLQSAWNPASLREVIDFSLADHLAVGAAPTWVLNNHDVIRSVSRFGKSLTGVDYSAPGDHLAAHLFDEMFAVPTDVELGRRRARAAVMLMLALPGGAYIYQGEELGLEEVEDLPGEVRQDPIWIRTEHRSLGRDGCRVPIPWTSTPPNLGFGDGSHRPWLPMPAHWAELAASVQADQADSFVQLYRALLAERRHHRAFDNEELTWEPSGDQVLSFVRGEPGQPGSVRCLVNFGPDPVPVSGELLVASGPLQVEADEVLVPCDTAVWTEL